MSLRNLTNNQLAEDYYWGSDNDRDAIREELNRREDEAEERACCAAITGKEPTK